MRSGENVSPQEIQVNLTNAIGADEEKALGIGWDVRNDLFFVKPGLMIGGKKSRKELTPCLLPAADSGGGNASLILNPKLILTLRICLSVHAQSYDPMGLVYPTRMIGNILFRKTLQFLKIVNDDKKLKNKIPWDAPVENFKVKWVDYFKMLSCLQETVFPRSYKPLI